jgi:exonuclease SbcD
MKFLHLADLHIGVSLHNHSLIDEQVHVFKQILGYVKTEKPEAVLIAGDVYDKAVPSTDAVRVFDDFLTDLAGCGTTVLLIAGNHDSPERLHYASRLLQDRNLYLYGAFDGSLHKVTLNDKYGKAHFWLLPFIRPFSVRSFFPQKRIESYGDALKTVLESAGIDYGERNVLLAHQFFTKSGVTALRSDSEIDIVGGLDGIDAGLVEGFDYVALGHLHGAQTAGKETIRYAGSPVKYSFSEWRHNKSASLVELKEKGDVVIKELPLKPIHEMREVKNTIEKVLRGEGIANKDDYLSVILTDEDEILDAKGRLNGKYPHVLKLRFENSRTNIDLEDVSADAEEIKNISPFELFEQFFLDINGSAMSSKQAGIARDLLEQGEEE